MEMKNLKDFGALCERHLPAILSGMAVVGVIGTGACTAQATIKTKEKLEELNMIPLKKGQKKATAMDKFKAIAPIWIPTALVGGSTIGCIIGAQVKNAKQMAVLAGGYALANDKLKDQKEKFDKAIGVSKDIETTDKNGCKILVSRDEDLDCYDEVIGKSFKSNMSKIQQAANRLNTAIFTNYSQSLCDFYDYLGEDWPDIAKSIEWNTDSKIPFMEVTFDGALTKDGRPYVSFTYDTNI